MRRPRRKAPPSAAIALPEPSTSVVLSTSGGGRIPARVMEHGADSLLLAITVPTKPLTPSQLEDVVLEYNSQRGRVRLFGAFTLEDPADPDLLRMREPRSVEVVQERSYVRIQAARPVIVYGAGAQARVESYTVDVSGGGCLLAGPDTLAMGEEVSFNLSLAPGERSITGVGRVVRIDQMGRRGLVFESISDLDRRRLVRFIFECQRTERRRGLSEERRGNR